MNTCLRVLWCAFVAHLTVVVARASGSWDSYNPQSCAQGTGIYCNGWGYVNGLSDVKANIYVDGNYVGQAAMTDWRGDIAGGGYWGWHYTINTSSLAVGSHAVVIWIGSNSQGQWTSFSVSYVQKTGSFTLTTPTYSQAIHFNAIATKSVTQSVPLNAPGLDQPYYRATYSDLNAAFGTNVAAYWNHWYSNGFSEGRSPFAASWMEGAAWAQSGMSLYYTVVSGPAYISNNVLYFNGTGTVVLSATQSGGVVSATGMNFYSAVAQISFSVTNNAPTVAWSPTPPPTVYTGAFVGAQATASDADGNLAKVWTQYRVNGGVWQDLANDSASGSTATSRNNGMPADLPGTIYDFQMYASDTLGANTGWIGPATTTVANRIPYIQSINATGTGLTYNSTYGHYQVWVNTPITINSQAADDDGNLAMSNIWRWGSPIDNTHLLLDDGTNGNPNNAASGRSSAKSVVYTPLVPGQYNFHADAQDTQGAWVNGGASITVWVYGPNNGATYISQNVNGVANPTALTVNAGQTFPVSVVMRNTGDKPWNGDSTPHSLGAVGDVLTWGSNRIALPQPTIAPYTESNSDATFSFTATAPSTPGVYTMQWQMVEDGVQWFGDRTPAVTITVYGPPGITSQPASQAVNSGASATFTVGVNAYPSATFQWRKNGANITGATAQSYNIGTTSPNDAGSYSVVVTNSYGSVTSGAATLTVNTAPAIISSPQSATVVAGNPITFSAAASGVPAPSYQWRKNGVAISGATSSSFALSSVQPGDAGSYDVVASNSLGSVTSAAATLTVYTVPVITNQPQSQSVAAGSTVTFGVAATGNPSPSYQWYKNGAAIAGAVGSTYTLMNVQTSDGGNYAATASNAAGSATSASAALTVTVYTDDTANQNQLDTHIP